MQKTLFFGMTSLVLCEIEAMDRPEFDGKVISHMRHMCERRFWVGVETYQVTSIATAENAVILALAVRYMCQCPNSASISDYSLRLSTLPKWLRFPFNGA